MTAPPHFVEGDVPPLEPGDRLTQAEFARRYEAMPPGRKAGLIDGVVHMPSPIRYRRHGRPHADVITWLGNYEAKTPGVAAADNATTRLDDLNEPKPDALLLIEPAHGGQATISPDYYVTSGPELVAEVAGSSASIERNAKLAVYQRHRIREYLIWQVRTRVIEWLVLRDDGYQPLPPDADGVVKSEVFPGLWLDVPAMLRGVLDRLHQGLASADHAAFVAGSARGRQGAATPAAHDFFGGSAFDV